MADHNGATCIQKSRLRCSVAIAALFLGWALAGSAQTVRIRCGATGIYTASDTTVWQSDQYFTGGQLLYTGYPVSNTPDPSLYRWARQALGPVGVLLGWSPLVQGSIRRKARAGLDAFMSTPR